MSTILASRAPSFFLRRRKYYKIIIIPQKTWPPELTTSVTFLRVSTKSWLAFSDIRKENISKIMIKTTKNIPKETVRSAVPRSQPGAYLFLPVIFAVCLLLNLAQLVKPLKSFCQQFSMLIFHQSIPRMPLQNN